MIIFFLGLFLGYLISKHITFTTYTTNTDTDLPDNKVYLGSTLPNIDTYNFQNQQAYMKSRKLIK